MPFILEQWNSEQQCGVWKHQKEMKIERENE